MSEGEERPWWRTVPFPEHWRAYVVIKLVVLAAAVLIGLHLLDLI